MRLLSLTRLASPSATSLAAIMLLFIAVLITPLLSAASAEFNLNSFRSDIPRKELARAEREELFSWVESTTAEILNVRGRKYNNFLGDNREYFTGRGWRSYFHALEVSKVLEGLKKGKLDMSATLDDSPPTRIISAEQDQRVYYWVKIPITLTYKTAKTTKDMPSDLVLLVTEKDGQPGIEQLVIYPRGAVTAPVSP